MKRNVALALLFTGCFGPASQVQSSAGITATGTAQRQSGMPLSQTEVELIRHPDALQVVGDLFTTVATLGLACLSADNDLCHAFETAKTDSSGHYQYALRGADTQGSTGEALLFTDFVRGSTPPGAVGPAGVGVDFYIQRDKLALPLLALWEDLGTEEDASGQIGFNWSALPSATGYRVVVSESGGGMVWNADAGSATSASFDARVTQDLAGSWAVWAQSKTHDAAQSTDFDFTHYSPAQPAQSSAPAIAPASRPLRPRSNAASRRICCCAGSRSRRSWRRRAATSSSRRAGSLSAAARAAASSAAACAASGGPDRMRASASTAAARAAVS